MAPVGPLPSLLIFPYFGQSRRRWLQHVRTRSILPSRNYIEENEPRVFQTTSFPRAPHAHPSLGKALNCQTERQSGKTPFFEFPEGSGHRAPNVRTTGALLWYPFPFLQFAVISRMKMSIMMFFFIGAWISIILGWQRAPRSPYASLLPRAP